MPNKSHPLKIFKKLWHFNFYYGLQLRKVEWCCIVLWTSKTYDQDGLTNWN